MRTPRRLILWAISGAASLALVFLLVSSAITTRWISITQSLAFAITGSVSFLVGIAVIEILISIFDRPTKAKNDLSRHDSPNRIVAASYLRPQAEVTAYSKHHDPPEANARNSIEPTSATSRSHRIALFVALPAVLLLIVAAVVTRQVIQNRRPPAAKTDATQTQDGERFDIQAQIDEKPTQLRAALRAYELMSKDIHRILSERLEDKRIGGAVAAATTNWQWYGNKPIFKLPEKMGLARISRPEALVNQVLNGRADIKDMTISRASEKRYRVTIKVVNRTNDFLRCLIDKGQIVEIKNGRNDEGNSETNSRPMLPQTVASSDEERPGDGIYVIPPSEDGTINFIAYCVNEGLAIPTGSANLAIYALQNTDYSSQDDLHLIMKKIRLSQVDA